ncbi:hypothetical protein CMI47_14895 [Candidatus Pacearchaeota archaeon]|nr:hypothetical protein [Candidatus Pacearchaeota archaeon]|tara:strand:- start:380 stop:1003 length:624 start_codon:yes stop_codon:yes gene_type:complete
MINKDTEIYCSFSSSPGNNGCEFFNSEFKNRNINAIYKSFYSDNIKKSVEAVKTLSISGFAVSMPFKIEVLDLVDELTKEVESIGSTNTIVNNKGYLTAYNTDYYGVKSYFETLNFSHIYIVGNGGFSKAVQYTCELMGKQFKIIDRDSWNLIDELRDAVLFNATPVDIQSTKCMIIDGRPSSYTGKQIALEQAKRQFEIYTGIEYG